jgi:hypothetical protein
VWCFDEEKEMSVDEKLKNADAYDFFFTTVLNLFAQWYCSPNSNNGSEFSLFL